MDFEQSLEAITQKFDAIETKLDNVVSELMFLAYCITGAACTKVVDDGTVTYKHGKHELLFKHFSDGFETLIEANDKSENESESEPEDVN